MRVPRLTSTPRLPTPQRDIAEQFQLLLISLFVVTLGCYIVSINWETTWAETWFFPLALVGLGLCMLLVRIGRLKIASILLLGGTYAMIVWLQVARGPNTRFVYLALVFVAVAWLLLGARGGIAFAALIFITTLTLFVRRVSLSGVLDRDLTVDVIGFLIILLGLSGVLWLFARVLTRAYDRVLEREHVSREYALAQEIQERLLPTTIAQPEQGRITALCEPAQEISGDFYDVIRLSKGRIGIVVGDVCGKGLPAALLMNLARTTLRAEAHHSAAPSTTMSRVSGTLAEGLSRLQFIALSYAIYDPRGHKLRLANAGQLEPVLVRSNRVQYLTTPGERFPLGFGIERRYDELTVQLQPGDRVVFYTDGLLEAQNASGELFGFDRLESVLQRLPKGSSAVERLRQALGRFTGSVGAADDVTIVELDLTTR